MKEYEFVARARSKKVNPYLLSQREGETREDFQMRKASHPILKIAQTGLVMVPRFAESSRISEELELQVTYSGGEI